MRRSSMLLSLLALLLLASAVVAQAAFSPKPGGYQGNVNGAFVTAGHSEGEGYFRLVAGGGKRSLVPYKSANLYRPIFTAPSNFKCNQLNADIPAKSIPVAGVSFDFQGTAPIGPGGAKRKLRFKGHWIDAAHLVGTTTISGGGCSHVDHWKMKTPPPA
jgi:hypothetical protein